MEFLRKLPIPMEIKEKYPLSSGSAERKKLRDEEIAKIFRGEDNRLIFIIGPCSADREDAVIDYTLRLASLQEKIKDKILIIPRIYTNKPRSDGDGYKGMIHQPDPHADEDMLAGIIATRRLHTKVIEESGLFCADEMLYTENHRYLSDLLSYVAIGARSVEDQQHRLTASGLDIPVGMKNPTSGDISVLLNSINAAQHPHKFLYRGWEVVSKGNPYAHAILRGYSWHGKNIPNYHYSDLRELYSGYSERGLANMSLIVDANHSNSGKRFEKQPGIITDVLNSCKNDPELRSLLKGFMVESYIEDGSQSVGGCVYGQSITDPCLGWEKSERLLLEVADML